MKAEVGSQKLKEAVSIVERFVQKQGTLPVLSCILMEMGKNSLVLKATNLDNGIEVSIPAKSDSKGVLAVPAHIISSFVSQLPSADQMIHIESDSGNLTVGSSRSKGVLKTVSPEDFPSIPRATDGQKFSVASDAFVKGLSSVWYSAAVSGIKPELSSVYLYKNDGGITFVSTDSFRLAEKKVRVEVPQSLGDILIPFKNVSDIARTLERLGGTVSISLSKNLISFEGNGIYMVSRIIDGVFPDYKQIIPKNYTTEAVVLKQDLINAIKMAGVFSDKFNQIRFVIDPKAKMFEVQTKNSDVGENKTSVDAALTGEKMEISFNSRYISDCFQSIEADSVSLQLNGTNRPMIIRPVSGDQTFMYLVMPMNR